MFTRIGGIAVRRRRLVLSLSGLFVLLAAVLGPGVFGRLDAGGFEDPSSESARAARVVSAEFDSGVPNVVFLVDTADGDVDSPASTAAGDEVMALFDDEPMVLEALSYWSLGNVAPLRSDDGATALVLARVGGTQNEQIEVAERLTGAAEQIQGAAVVEVGGELPGIATVTHTIEGDLARAEAIAVPVTLVLLVLVFAGLVAAGLPLVLGAMAVLGTFVTLYAITLFTDVSIFSINLVTALGLGLAIDYSLFIVSRFREELARRPRAEPAERDRALVDDAVVATVASAGRTVAFSAVTVAVSLAALMIFPVFFLRSFAYAGIGVTLVAMASSILTLPAVLAWLGRRVDKGQFSGAHERIAAIEADPERGFWYRTAIFAQRHAVGVSVPVVGVLLLLGVPFLSVDFGVPDERVLPEGTPTRVATERLRSDFSSAEADAFPLVLPNEVSDGEVDAYASDVSALDGVTRVDAPTGRYVDGARVLPTDEMLAAQRIDGAVRLRVVPGVEAISPRGEELVGDIRSVQPPGGESLLGGRSASFVDTKAAIAQRLPWALAMIVVSTLVLLFAMFGSVLVPIKAILLNTLSLSATFGAMVWVFQWGHGSGLLGFTPTGLTDLTTPVLMFCIAFGLSMDYEVFLLSRIAEEHHRGVDNETAVAMGLQRTGRIVTAAAGLLAVTFLAFATSGITFIKLFGLGLALAVLMDATIVRALLVPAFMGLAGDANWWAPRWLRSVHDRFGLSESEPGAYAPVDPGAVPDADPVEGDERVPAARS